MPCAAHQHLDQFAAGGWAKRLQRVENFVQALRPAFLELRRIRFGKPACARQRLDARTIGALDIVGMPMQRDNRDQVGYRSGTVDQRLAPGQRAATGVEYGLDFTVQKPGQHVLEQLGLAVGVDQPLDQPHEIEQFAARDGDA